MSLPLCAMAEPPAAVTQVCATCHGIDGNGTTPPNLTFPKLAGLQVEYLNKQLKDFKAGKRKSVIMAPMVASLTAEDMQAIAGYYAAQKPAPGSVNSPEILSRGKKMHLDGDENLGVPACAGCHEVTALGVPKYPRLAGQHAEYIYQQLKLFQSGERDNDRGLPMQSVAVKLSDKDMRAVAEYLGSLK